MFHARFRLLALSSALLAGSLASASADQKRVPYKVLPGQTSAPIPVPAVNTPVTMTCVQNTVGDRGVGQATILRVNPPAFLEWVGNDIANAGTVSTGFSSSPGTHIIYCDYTDKTADLQVANSIQVQIKNTSTTTTMAGVINFVW